MYLAACLVGVEGSQTSSHYKWRKCTILWLHLIPSFSIHTSCTMQIWICYPLTSFFPSLYLKNFSWLFAILKYSFYLWSTALASIKSAMQLSNQEIHTESHYLTSFTMSLIMLYITPISKLTSKAWAWPKLKHYSTYMP